MKKINLIIVIFVSLLFIAYNSKHVNCFFEYHFTNEFTGNSWTWVRYSSLNYNFSFKKPACWNIETQSISGIDFMTVSRWMGGHLYTVSFYQSEMADANQNLETKKDIIIGKNIKASYSELDNDFVGTDVESGYKHVGKGYDKVYSFQVDENKYVSMQYQYEQSVNGKKQVEIDIGREVADRMVESIVVYNSPVQKYLSLICSKCF